MTVVLAGGRGGWWHHYVCPVHGVELEHEGLLGGEYPSGGVACRHGCRVDTPQVRGAWRALAHRACARELRRRGDQAEVRRLLARYAAVYAGSTVDEDAEPWMLPGRMFAQALTEALWAVDLGEAAWRSGVEPELRAALAEQAAAARAALVEQGRFTANYTAWLCAAGAVCTRDPQWLTGRHGTFAHVLAGTGADGWQWEGSTYYHAFVLLAYHVALRALPDVPVPAEVRERLAAMGRVLDVLSPVWTSAALPALHDGPFERAGYDAELALLPRTDAPVDPVTVFGDAGYAVLRGPALRAVVHYGAHSGSHAHRDKLALSLYGNRVAWQPDPGQVPYGHPAWREFYASTAAHPAFSVDGAEQAECAGYLVEAGDKHAVVACDAAYPGVSARRHAALDGATLVDELTVACDRPRRIALHLRPGTGLRLTAGGRTDWDGLTGRHTADVPTTFWARPGPGTADDPQRVRTWVDWIAPETTHVTFRSEYTVEASDA